MLVRNIKLTSLVVKSDLNRSLSHTRRVIVHCVLCLRLFRSFTYFKRKSQPFQTSTLLHLLTEIIDLKEIIDLTIGYKSLDMFIRSLNRTFDSLDTFNCNNVRNINLTSSRR